MLNVDYYSSLTQRYYCSILVSWTLPQNVLATRKTSTNVLITVDTSWLNITANHTMAVCDARSMVSWNGFLTRTTVNCRLWYILHTAHTEPKDPSHTQRNKWKKYNVWLNCNMKMLCLISNGYPNITSKYLRRRFLEMAQSIVAILYLPFHSP